MTVNVYRTFGTWVKHYRMNYGKAIWALSLLGQVGRVWGSRLYLDIREWREVINVYKDLDDSRHWKEDFAPGSRPSLHICPECGRVYYGSSHRLYCVDCSENMEDGKRAAKIEKRIAIGVFILAAAMALAFFYSYGLRFVLAV